MDAQELLDIIDKRINDKIPRQADKRFSATVISVDNGTATIHLASDPVGKNIVAQNSRELPLEIGDQVYVNAINGNLTNSFVDLRKGYNDNEIYVHTSLGSDYNSGTSSNPFKTLQHAVSILPKNLNGRWIDIFCVALSSTEDVSINGFYGNGTINIVTASGSTMQHMRNININVCSGVSINIDTLYANKVIIKQSNFVWIVNSNITSITSENAITAYTSTVHVSGTSLNNAPIGISANAMSLVQSSSNTGSGLNYGLASYASVIFSDDIVPPHGTIADIYTDNSGQIYGVGLG